MAKKLIQAMVVLFILLGEIVNAEPVRAAEMISCDANGKCVVRLDYYGTLYNENIEHGFDQLGQGTNSWPIPAGGAAQSFGARIGSLGGSDYHNLQKPDGSWMPALGVCDVADLVHYVAELNGLKDAGSVDVHAPLPVLPTNSHYANSIYQDDSGVYTNDLLMTNPGTVDATIRWTITNHVLTIWVDKGDQPFVLPELPNLVATPVLEAQSDLVIVDETEFLKTTCPNMNTQSIITNYPKKLVVHHTDTSQINDFFVASIRSADGTVDHCGWDAPPYNAVITPDGVVHVLTAWGAKSNNAGCDDANSPDGCNNTDYYAISLVGDFQVRQSEVPEAQLKALTGYVAKLIREGNFNASDVALVGHRDITPGTSCPGDVLYNLLPTVLADAKQQATTSGNQPNVSLPIDFSSVRWDLIIGIILLVVVVSLLIRRRGNQIEVVLVDHEALVPQKESPTKKFLKVMMPQSIVTGILFWIFFPSEVKALVNLKLLGNLSGGFDIIMVLMLVSMAGVWYSVTKVKGEYYGVRSGNGKLLIYKNSKKQSRRGRVSLIVIVLAIILLVIAGWWFVSLRPQLTGFIDQAAMLGQAGSDMKGAVELLNQWGWGVDTGFIDRLTQAPDELVTLIQTGDMVAVILIILSVATVVLSFIGIKEALVLVAISLALFSVGKGGAAVDWVVLWKQIAQTVAPSPTTNGITPPTVRVNLPQGDNILYAGVYGALNGWGTLGYASTAAEAIKQAEDYAVEIRQWYPNQVVPVVNVRVNSNEDQVDAIISGCATSGCIVMIDVTPNQDVSGYIERWAVNEQVWFDLDLEHRGVPTAASEFNGWAARYAEIRQQSGFSSLGMFAFYDFRSEPWLTPPSEVVYSYNDGKTIVIPIFDGHCTGTACAEFKYSATRATLDNYPGAPAVGIMEFLRRWGCGSVYGDCGFTPAEYYAEFKPILLMSQ